MLAMMAVIVDYTFKMFLTFYRRGPLNVAGFGVTYLPTLPLDVPGCLVNNVLVNALKKLTQCIRPLYCLHVMLTA